MEEAANKIGEIEEEIDQDLIDKILEVEEIIEEEVGEMFLQEFAEISLIQEIANLVIDASSNM